MSRTVDAFPPDSLIRQISDEPAIGFGAGRALLLQIAHPHVAAGVAEHSDFTDRPFKRLQGTLEAVYTMVYGDLALSEAVGRRVQWIHRFVTSPAYRANDPANLLWVHATLLDSALGCYQRLVRRLSDDELEAYYEQMAVIAERFGCPRNEQPATYAAFRNYFAEQVETMDVTDVGRRLSADVLAPKLPLKLHVPLAPLLAVQRLAAVGTLPVPIRQRFGFSWDPRRQRRLNRVHAAARAYHRAVPRPVRIAPTHLQGRLLLSQARRHVAAWEKKVAQEVRPGVA